MKERWLGFDGHKDNSEIVIVRNDDLDAAYLEKGNRAVARVGGLRVLKVLGATCGKMV